LTLATKRFVTLPITGASKVALAAPQRQVAGEPRRA
jgi:hypothetical protein